MNDYFFDNQKSCPTENVVLKQIESFVPSPPTPPVYQLTRSVAKGVVLQSMQLDQISID
jgi:hypothetical protein